MSDLPLFDRPHPAIAQCEDAANRRDPTFSDRAKAHVLRHLHRHGATSGEDLTDACLAAGIVPHDARAFGGVFMSLSRKGVIEKCGFVPRRKGHGTSGGLVWRAAR